MNRPTNARPPMLAAAPYAHLFGRGPRPGFKPIQIRPRRAASKSPASEPKPARKVEKERARAAAASGHSFAHLFENVQSAAPADYRRPDIVENSAATAAAITRAAAKARGEIATNPPAPKPGSLAAKILAAAAKARTPR